MFSLDDLTTPSTREEVQQSIYDVLAAVGVSTTTWQPGAVVRTMILAVSIVIAAFSRLTAAIARSGFLELSSGQWLTLVARYVYGVERSPAGFAEGSLTLVNTGGGVFLVDPEDLTVRSTVTGKEYRNTSAFTLSGLSTITVAIRAVEEGSGSTAAPDTITEIVTTMVGVTARNATALVGRDEEQDPELRSRCSEKLGSLSPFGPWDAYAYAARTAKRADGTLVGVTRVRVARDGTGRVFVYVATSSGGVTGSAADPLTDLGAVALAVQRNAAPDGITAVVASATAYVVPVAYQAYAYNTSGLSDSAIQELIGTQLAAFFGSQPVGGHVLDPEPGRLFTGSVRAAVSAARPEIFNVVLSSPAADISLPISGVPVLGTITHAVTQITPPEGH